MSVAGIRLPGFVKFKVKAHLTNVLPSYMDQCSKTVILLLWSFIQSPPLFFEKETKSDFDYFTTLTRPSSPLLVVRPLTNF